MGHDSDEKGRMFPSEDTSPEVDAEYLRRMRALPLEERARRFFEMWQAARALTFEGIKLRHPNASAHEQRELFKALCKSAHQRA